jgi:NAD(P)-dependent dehydrogenase (short-subunit alcohol dehydrogenase family)
MSTVLVTGSSTGFGRLIALELAREGHRVFATMREPEGRNAPAAESLRAAARAEGRAVEVVALDVTRDDSVSAAVDTILSRAGALDVLVNNAGVACAGLVETFTPAAAQRVFDVNVYGPLRMARAVLPGMRRRGSGLVVYISSTLGREVTPFLGVYAASKFALEALAESLRYETAPLGVDSVIVQPGTFPTTAILGNLVAPDDAARAEGYGPVAQLPAGLFAGLGELARSGRAPDPQRVADAVAAVVRAPVGSRPARVVVDPNGSGGAARLNALSGEVQSSILAGFGLEALGAVRPAR